MKPLALSFRYWRRTPQEVGELIVIVAALQLLMFMLCMPLCCERQYTVFMGSPYIGADLYLLLRLWGIPKLRHSAIPEITTFQRVVILASPVWMGVLSVYAFDRLVP